MGEDGVYAARIIPAELDGRFVVVDPEFAAKLTSHHRRSFELEAEETAAGPQQITRDVPNVGEEALEVLDERGVIRPGNQVKPGTLLVGRVTPRGSVQLSPEEKLLRAIFGDAAGDTIDAALRAPPGCFATVLEAELDPSGRFARVEVGWSRPLEVGDLLEIDGASAMVAAIRPIGADLAWRQGRPSGRVKKAVLARDVLHARSIGPYNLRTLQPTEGREAFGGQRLEPAQASLLARYAPWALWEALTIKADQVGGRTRTYEAIVKGDDPAPVRPSGATGSTKDIFSFFESAPEPEPGKAFALVPEVIRWIAAHLRGSAIEVDFEAEIVEAKLIDAAMVRAGSSGLVGAGELFSQKIFGPLEDYRCGCGKYARMKHRGIVCEICGVEVIQSKVRRERFGHVELAEPVVHPSYRGEVALLLGCSESELRSRPGREVVESLSRLDLEAIDAIETGPRAELAWALHRARVAPTALVLEVMPVLPPDLRPQGTRLDGWYQALVEAQGQPRAVQEIVTALAEAVDRAWSGGVFSKPVDYSAVASLVVDPTLARGACRVPRECLAELFKPFTYRILEEHGYVTTIKAAKRMVEQGRPEAEQALVEASRGHPLLLTAGAAMVCRTPEAWDHPAIAVDADTAARLDATAVTIHLPLCHAAAIECSRLLELLLERERHAAGWLSAAMLDRALFARARDAAIRGEREGITDGLLAYALGRPPPEATADDLAAWREAQRASRAAVRASQGALLEAEIPTEALLSRPVEELEMSIRCANILASVGITTIGALVSRTEAELLKLKGMNAKTLAEIKELLMTMGLSPGMRHA